MTMTQADLTRDDGVMAPRSGQSKRRTFTAEYKARIVAEYDAATEKGERGAILRREGLYSSHIIEWRKAAEAVRVEGLDTGGRSKRERAREREVDALRARAEKAEADLAKSQAALDLMGKAFALLEQLSESADSPTRSRK